MSIFMKGSSKLRIWNQGFAFTFAIRLYFLEADDRVKVPFLFFEPAHIEKLPCVKEILLTDGSTQLLVCDSVFGEHLVQSS